uniref:Hemelipoglycoprotein-1 n=1 Tax=Dermanyssus gallinae TaxID=34641 RepID=A0A0M4FKP0_9ACAR|nr:hemelipoglycoprotein-1 [Dermanyssus gallinae]
MGLRRSCWAQALLGLGLVALTNAQGQIGKEYRYSYTGHMVVVSTTMHTQKPGMAFRSNVRVQRIVDNTYGLKIEDFEVATANERETDWSETEKMAFVKNERLSSMVERPFLVHLERTENLSTYEFKSLETHSDDPVWSTNIKKGLVSLITLHVPFDNDEQIYSSVEPTVYGKCNVHWHRQSKPHWTRPDSKVLNISRAIDHENCETVANRVYGSVMGTPCMDGSCQRHHTYPVSTSSQAKYSLVAASGDTNNWILETARDNSVFTHAPHTENGNVLKLKTAQRMRLIDTVDATEKLEIVGETQVDDQLMMHFTKRWRLERSVDLDKADDFVLDWDIRGCSNGTIALLQKLRSLRNADDNQLGMFDNNVAETFSAAIEMMYLLDREQLAVVYDRIVKAAPEAELEQAQRLFVEVASAAGSTTAMKFVMDKFQAGDISVRFMRPFLSGITRGLFDRTSGALEIFENFCTSDQMKALPEERRQCLLAYTALVYDTYRLEHFNVQKHERKDTRETIFKRIVPEYSVAAEEGREAFKTYMLIAGNLKTASSVEFLARAVLDEKLDRLTAMDAMRTLIMTADNSEVARKAALTVYADSSKPAELRMLAAIVIMRSNPPLSVFYSMADRLLHEKSDQVRSYVVSMFKELSQTTHPFFRHLANKAHYVAPKLEARLPSEWKRKDYLTSHTKLASGYHPKYDHGGHSIISMIMSDSYVPRDLYVNFGDFFAGFFFDNFGMSISQQGMERLIDHFNNPRTFGNKFGRNLWNMAGRRRQTRDAASVEHAMDEIDSTLNIHTKKYDPMRLDMTFSAFGENIHTVSLNESFFLPLLSPDYKPGTLLNKILSTERDMHSFKNLRDMTFMIPTAIGMPAWFDVQLPTVLSCRRKESSFDFGNEGALKLKLDQRIVMDAQLEESLRFGVPGLQVSLGVGFKRRLALNLPIKLDVDANVATGKVVMNQDFVLPRDIMRYKFEPYTIEDNFKEPEKTTYLALFKDEELVEFKSQPLKDLLGIDFFLEGKQLPKSVLSWDFSQWLKSDIRQKLYYAIVNPKWRPRSLSLSAAPAKEHPTTGRVLTFKHKMTPPEATERPGSRFEEFEKDLPESFVHVIQVSNELTSSKKRRADLEVRYSYTPNRVEHWIQLFYDRTPLSSQDTDHTKLCMVAKVKQTTTDWEKLTKEQVMHVNDGQRMDVLMNLQYGKSCKTGDEPDASSLQMLARATYEHSDEQKRWLSELTTGETRSRVHGLENPYMKFYTKCIKYLEKGLLMPFACHKFIVHTSQLNNMTLDVEVNDRAHVLTNPCMSTLRAYLAAQYDANLRMFAPQRNVSRPGHWHMNSVVREPCINQRLADIAIVGPYHSSFWESVPVSWGAHWAPRTATHLGSTNMQSYSRKWFHRYCDIQLNSVATFDNVVYELPETNCWKVLAKDCSEMKVFTLLGRANADKKKEIRLLVDKYEVHLKNVDGKIVLTLNGAEEVLAERQPKLVKNENGFVTLVILNKGHGLMQIDAPIYGIYMLAMDSAAFIQVAPYYRGKLCGLCGNFNLDRQHEFHTTDGCHHRTPWSFARNFVIPSDQCAPVPEATDAGQPYCRQA